jgi:hypothetical protein
LVKPPVADQHGLSEIRAGSGTYPVAGAVAVDGGR